MAEFSSNHSENSIVMVSNMRLSCPGDHVAEVSKWFGSKGSER